MYNKTIWNPGDIITQEKWDNINNNLSIIGAYQLPVTIEEVEVTPSDTPILKSSVSSSVSSTDYKITIHKSYNEIIKLLKQGIICYLYNNLNGVIIYISNYNNTHKTLNNDLFYEENENMVSAVTKPSLPITK